MTGGSTLPFQATVPLEVSTRAHTRQNNPVGEEAALQTGAGVAEQLAGLAARGPLA